MIFREARIEDMRQIQVVRNAVKENRLSNPNLVTDEDCKNFMFDRGKGWVCEVNERIVGFAIADLLENNIWALFVDPDFEGRGIGKQLYTLMPEWYFKQHKKDVWLGTAEHARAETFYERMGWRRNRLHGKEIEFEMTYAEWQNLTDRKNVSDTSTESSHSN